MPSTFSPSLRIELIGAGEQAGTWGTTTNTNLGTLVEASVAGATTVSVTTANQALTIANGAADQARNAVLQLTTTTGAPFAVYAPPDPKQYTIYNASAHAATVFNSTVDGNTTAAGTGVTIPAGETMTIWSNGTNFRVQNSRIEGNITGNAATATTLQTARTINGTSFNGSANVTVPVNTTQKSDSVAYQIPFVTSVTAGNQNLFTDSAANITYNPSTNTLTTTTFAGALTGNVTGNVTGNASTATTLQTARTIGGVSFNGSANINLPGVNTAGNQNTTGTAANVTGTVAIANGGTGGTTAQAARNNIAGAVTSAQYLRGNGTNVLMSAIQAADVPTLNQNTTGSAATLTTARTIGGVSFNGSANINLPGVNTAGNQNTTGSSASCTGNSATATTLQTARTINGVSFNGSANITLPTVNTSGDQTVAGVKTFSSTITGSISGNAGTATTLQTTRSINGTNFNGSANITTANWGTARTLTIGSTGKSVNGSGDVSWSLSEIGAPSTTGSGASGTWGISITGNAATASSVAYTNVTGRPASALRQIFDSTLSYATAGSKTFTFRLLYGGSPAREMVSPDSFVVETRLQDSYTTTNNGTVINYTVSKAVALPNNVTESRLVVTISGFNSNLFPNNIIMRIFVQDVTAVTSCTLL
jgi:hypothetical protein